MTGTVWHKVYLHRLVLAWDCNFCLTGCWLSFPSPPQNSVPIYNIQTTDCRTFFSEQKRQIFEIKKGKSCWKIIMPKQSFLLRVRGYTRLECALHCNLHPWLSTLSFLSGGVPQQKIRRRSIERQAAEAVCKFPELPASCWSFGCWASQLHYPALCRGGSIRYPWSRHQKQGTQSYVILLYHHEVANDSWLMVCSIDDDDDDGDGWLQKE